MVIGSRPWEETDTHPGASLEILEEELMMRIMCLSARAWEHRHTRRSINLWLDNFTNLTGLGEKEERIHALFLLSQFLFFGGREVRVLLKAVYREMVLQKIICRATQKLGANPNTNEVCAEVWDQISKVKFLGIGNPSESGTHLLYFFRQENSLKKSMFMSASEIIKADSTSKGRFERKIRLPEVTDYIFIDDICGSGETARNFSNTVLAEILNLCGHSNLKFHYYCLFGTERGMRTIRDETVFGENSGAVYELDDTFKCLDKNSRFMANCPKGISADNIRNICEAYGQVLWQSWPTGFDDNQLLLGFSHNTPDNTLPIFWADKKHTSQIQWTPAFQRHMKYGY